jgi:hypothetical protein
MAPRAEDLSGTLRACFLRVVRDFDVAARVRGLLGARPRGRVLAVGKAASAMLAGAWDATVERALIVVPEGTRVPWAGARVEVRLSTHPSPSVASLEAAAAALAFAEEGIDLALVSGGASALLSAPAPGLTLARKVEVTSALSNAGVPIRTLNLVRRHLSTIKGGGLARVSRRPTLSVLLSDVLEGGPEDVGSGPTVADPTTAEEARAVLAEHGLEAPVVETLKPSEGLGAGARDDARRFAPGLRSGGRRCARGRGLRGSPAPSQRRRRGGARTRVCGPLARARARAGVGSRGGAQREGDRLEPWARRALDPPRGARRPRLGSTRGPLVRRDRRSRRDERVGGGGRDSGEAAGGRLRGGWRRGSTPREGTARRAPCSRCRHPPGSICATCTSSPRPEPQKPRASSSRWRSARC